MRKITFCLALFFLLMPVSFAATEKTTVDITSFQTVYMPAMPELIKPTVVRVKLPESEQRFGLAILENETGISQGYSRQYEAQDQITFKVLQASDIIGSKIALIDNDYNTFAEFNLDLDQGQANIELEASQAVTASSLSLALDQNVALPYEIAISALVNDTWKTIVAKTRLYDTTVNFPETTAQNWKLEFRHAQLLRVREIELRGKVAEKNDRVTVINWLARPGKTYKLYTAARSYVSVPATETGELTEIGKDVLELVLGDASPNPQFKEPDGDSDGIVDILDNCVNIANRDQADIDQNGRGDACEDFDGDGVYNTQDNCPDHPNLNQLDKDGDGIGDVCDEAESRVTEANPWLPWVGMGVAAILVFVVIVRTVKISKQR